MDYSNLIGQLIQHKAHRVTWYESPNKITRATRKLYKGKIREGKYMPLEVLITNGRPNYLEREFIKKCKAAGEPFPVKKLQFQMPPKKRKK